MGILLQYNNATSYTFAELLNSTGLSPEMLTSQLTTVCKAKVLLVTNGKLGDESSKYELNEDFKSKKVRLNLNIPGKAETKRETEETHKTIDDDRNMYIQAAIVRIMKTRKVMKHNNLITEVIDQLSGRFKPKISDIKKCIDVLMEKEYMERKEGEKDMYSYVA
ncbi:hypothetical protein HDV05_007142 [Chytridiales sp. JEL 0842]|nr:hypothetical protein HDV05_007142 [Chytridiales sp. JEL 0842]